MLSAQWLWWTDKGLTADRSPLASTSKRTSLPTTPSPAKCKLTSSRCCEFPLAAKVFLDFSVLLSCSCGTCSTLTCQDLVDSLVFFQVVPPVSLFVLRQTDLAHVKCNPLYIALHQWYPLFWPILSFTLCAMTVLNDCSVPQHICSKRNTRSVCSQFWNKITRKVLCIINFPFFVSWLWQGHSCCILIRRVK